jgi:hypothetical protein
MKKRSTMTKKALAVGLLLAALVVGCSKPEDKFVGKWDGKMEFPPEFFEMMKSMAEGMSKSMNSKDGRATPSPDLNADEMAKELSNVKTELDLKKGGTCTLTSDAGGSNMVQSGTWTLSEDGTSIAVKLSPPAMSGAAAPSSTTGSFSQETVYVVSEDKKSMVYEQNQMGMKVKMSFTKR